MTVNNDKMQAAIFTGPNAIELRSVPKPDRKDDHVLVKIEACAICTFEQRVFTGQQKVPFPLVGGHEIFGSIVAFGQGEFCDLQVGDKVSMIEPNCGICKWCRRGMDQLCENRPGKMEYDGIIGPWGFSQYVNLHKSAVHRFAKPVSNEVGVFFEPLSCAIHAVRMAKVELGDDVVIIGGGPMGLLNLMVARCRGARTILSELLQERIEKARLVGAADVINASKGKTKEQVMKLTEGKGADVVIVTAGVEEANIQALEMIAPQGRIVLFASAHPAKPFRIDPNDMHKREYSVFGTVSKTQLDAQSSIKMLSHGLIDPSPLVEATRPLSDIEVAIKRAAEPDSYRVIIKPWG